MMTLSEFRKARIREVAEANHVDMIVATLPANILYLTNGYVAVNQNVLTRSECAVGYLPEKDKYVYIVGYADLPTVFEFAGMDVDVYYSGGAFFFERTAEGDPFADKIFAGREKALPSTPDAWERAVRENLPAGAVVAIDESRIFSSNLDVVKSKLHDYQITNGTELFMQARLIKHPEEVAGIEKSARCAEDSLMAALTQFKPGMTEYEIGQLYCQELSKRNATPTFCVVTSGLRSAFSDTPNDKTRPIGDGDMIRFDFGCSLDGYCSDLGRVASVGKASDKLVRYYEAIRAGLDAAIEYAKPGVAAGELFDCAMAVVRKSGIPHYRRHHTGHGIGLETYDNPSIAHNDRTPIVANMTFNMETPYYELGWGGIMIEDTFVMTETGLRMLDQTTREIINL